MTTRENSVGRNRRENAERVARIFSSGISAAFAYSSVFFCFAALRTSKMGLMGRI